MAINTIVAPTTTHNSSIINSSMRVMTGSTIIHGDLTVHGRIIQPSTEEDEMPKWYPIGTRRILIAFYSANDIEQVNAMAYREIYDPSLLPVFWNRFERCLQENKVFQVDVVGSSKSYIIPAQVGHIKESRQIYVPDEWSEKGIASGEFSWRLQTKEQHAQINKFDVAIFKYNELGLRAHGNPEQV
jgi:hypothetical protein